uniref:HTH CENPB-type domain-containing protein n=1 Tax=Trichogramma kaykai TaxID=54128 RepID=A0ABD2X0P4_9HYME
MAPSAKKPSKPKSRKVLNIADKIKILNLLDDGEKVAAVGRKFNVNESTVRTIRDNAANIRNSAAHLGKHAVLTKVTRNLNVTKMEEMLMVWLQDLFHKSIPVGERAIRDEALEFYNYLEKKNPTNESFLASKGWFAKFKNRFHLHNVKFTGESASADYEAANKFPLEVRQIIREKETPRALKGKDKKFLPVFWRSNKTAWVTKVNFKEWFFQVFVPDVKEYLAKENLSMKILLLLDNCASHGDEIMLAHPNVEILFLPPNTTSLIQPMDQTVIATFKSYYLRRIMKDMLRFAKKYRDDDQQAVKIFWKKFSILDGLGLIGESWQEISEQTLNASWSKLLPELVFGSDSRNYEQTLESVIGLTREVGGPGFEDVQESEILEIVLPSEEFLTAEETEDILQRPTEEKTEDKSEIESLEKHFHTFTVKKIINVLEELMTQAVAEDPVLTRSMHFKHICSTAAQIYEDLYKDYQRKIKQSRITDFFSQ